MPSGRPPVLLPPAQIDTRRTWDNFIQLIESKPWLIRAYLTSDLTGFDYGKASSSSADRTRAITSSTSRAPVFGNWRKPWCGRMSRRSGRVSAAH